ncbi:MAG: flagellar biosynthesis anti-sigma factor FlgM [Candidatus Pelagadaptatus aseana]|uniref:flagellar biosynthesis anti-sigma factor FlgM n=1 Tax=Candidatus Pelagadaptatus aseana TaxID=3120508 RepID=UPI0039B146CA
MIIDSNSGIYSSGGGAKNRTNAAASGKDGSTSAPKPAASAPAKDVSLSSEAHTLNRLEAQINASPDIDASRVAQIKQAIADGTFEINAERIAEKMLNQDDLLGS